MESTMTMRSTAQWAARQAQTGISRATIREVDDNHLCQECKTGDVSHSETPTNFEIWQPLGVTSVPLKQQDAQQGQQDQQGQQGGQAGGGQGGGGQGNGEHFNKNQPKGDACEMVMLYANGHRAHPIGLPQDRRCRPYDMEPGEGGLYDSQDGKQMTYFRNRGDGSDGVYIVGCDAEQQQQGGQGGAGAGTQATGSSSGGGGQSTDRAVYIRYAQKKKQSRKPQKQQQQGGQSGGGASPGTQANGSSSSSQSSGGQQGQQRYKHEGDSVLTQVKLDKSLIDFSDGGGTVGHYDSGKKEWIHHDGQKTHSTRADKNHSHIRHDGNNVWCDSGNVYKSKPFVIQPDDCS
jgi:hypothetical protein